MGSEFVWREKKKEPGKLGLYYVAGKGSFNFIRNVTEQEMLDMDIIKKEDTANVGRPPILAKIKNKYPDEKKDKKEKRAICGKARICKIVGGKVSEVYDENSEQYLPIKDFQKLYNEKGERIGYVKAEKVVDDDMKGDKKIDKKPEVQIPLSNTVTTSNINLSTSGTSGTDIAIPNNPDINVNVNAEAKKGKVKDKDPYSWYIKRVLKY